MESEPRFDLSYLPGGLEKKFDSEL